METSGKIEVGCPACGAKFFATSAQLGHKARCGRCGNVFFAGGGLARANEDGSDKKPIIPKTSTSEKPGADGSLLGDTSLLTLLAANIVMIFWAFFAKWSLATIMWCYWGQSVGIGVVWFFKILALQNFSTRGFRLANRPAQRCDITLFGSTPPESSERLSRPSDMPATSWTKIQTAVLFAAHYGLFHLSYAAILLTHTGFEKNWRAQISHLTTIIPVVAALAACEIFSFFRNRQWRTTGRVNLGKLMAFPYMRIIPMHIGIVVAGGAILDSKHAVPWGPLLVPAFMGLKTVVDVAMYVKQRGGFADDPWEPDESGMTAVQRAAIEYLSEKVKCPRGHACCKSGITDLQSNWIEEMDMIRCHAPRPDCKHKLETSVGCYCKCPVRQFIAKEFKV